MELQGNLSFFIISSVTKTYTYRTNDTSIGYNYRVVAEVKAYSGSAVETRSLTSSEVAY